MFEVVVGDKIEILACVSGFPVHCDLYPTISPHMPFCGFVTIQLYTYSFDLYTRSKGWEMSMCRLCYFVNFNRLTCVILFVWNQFKALCAKQLAWQQPCFSQTMYRFEGVPLTNGLRSSCHKWDMPPAPLPGFGWAEQVRTWKLISKCTHDNYCVVSWIQGIVCILGGGCW